MPFRNREQKWGRTHVPSRIQASSAQLVFSRKDAKNAKKESKDCLMPIILQNSLPLAGEG